MPRLSADQWAAIRLEWEGEPTASFHGLAQKHGVDKSQISRIAKREGWSKTGQIGSINENAQRRADAKVNAEGGSTQRPINAEERASRDESESVRADVLARLRTEWAELESFRKVALLAMKEAHKAGDKNAWSIAKLAADTALANMRTLSIKQDGERAAWGLDLKADEDIVIRNPRRAEA
jgi:hypothetical protein